ncbi:VOC family protein [Gilvimarinus sp. SDUM040013]|uniref:VOC family protein n=1 Tax=Gilvimarinus gilvus TaxID=3058038 RepID=A0ABU4S1F4_9GAMM|nr:VOC family protein [Gilvimarinus sp. SDUM040013]MDO3388073.1 VOC family protein [Gilvimarinus sp. SDUM040013]MDX6850981.1 VOC family protein [Gilvimarinus sp. SDUM040013]
MLRRLLIALGILPMAAVQGATTMTTQMLEQPTGHTYERFAGAQPRPFKQRLHLFLLGVADVERSQRFFEALGWTVSPVSSDGFVMVDLGGYALALLSGEAFAEEVFGEDIYAGERGPGAATYRGVAFAYLAESAEQVPEMLARALAAGGTLVKPVTRTPWGINAFFKDPDGNLFEIDYEQKWVLNSAGQLVVDRVNQE